MKVSLKKWKFKSKSKIDLFIITLILLLAHKCFYMWLQDDYMTGNIKYSDISIFMSVIYTGIVLMRYGTTKQCKWKYWLYAYFGLVVVSAISAWGFYNQSLFRGITVQREQIAYFILFFGIERLFEKRVINREDLIKIIYILCWIELILCTVQYFIYAAGGTLFMRVGTGLRYESTRLYFDPGILMIVVFDALQNFFRGKKRIRNVIFIIWIVMFLMVMGKMRMMTGALLVTIVVGWLIWRGAAIKKAVYALLGSAVGVFTLSRMTLFNDLIHTITNISGDASYGYRISGRATFMMELIKSPLTGRGYPSVSSPEACAPLKGYLFVDNGIFGLIYSYGIIGLLWWLGMWGSLMIKAWRIRKKTIVYFLYFLYYVIGLVTDFSWFWTATCSFTVVAAMFFDEIRE